MLARPTSRCLAIACLALVAGAPTAARAAKPAGPDLSAWQQLPVFYVEDGAQRGRMMPLDTLAREMVEMICHRQSPTLGLLSGVSEADAKGRADLAAARGLFPDNGLGSRKYPPAELLLSWIVQPQTWEEVPFIQCKYEELRELMELPLEDAATKVKYTTASPRQIEQADALWDYVAKLAAQEREAGAKGDKYADTPLDTRVKELVKGYSAYRLLTNNPTTSVSQRLEFRMRMVQLAKVWRDLRDSLEGAAKLIPDELAAADKAFDELIKVAEQGTFTAQDAEDPANRFRQATATIADRMERLSHGLTTEAPANLPPEELQRYATLFASLKHRSRTAAERAQRVHLSIYDDGNPLALVPALNAPALRREREPEDDVHPWLNLPTLLYGTPAVLDGYPNGAVAYPQAAVDAVRVAYKKLAETYPEAATRPNDVKLATEQFAAALADLGRQAEPLRKQLIDEADSDQDLFAYTAYPPAGSTAAEVHYNALQPFVGSWIIALAAVACFALSFGVARKAMFWLGTLLLIAALVWTGYGFYLRMIITGWAPVTNMYETVIYVPAVVATLGLWFAFLPAIWPGLKNAWRMTAVPGTWEATELTREQEQFASEATWSLVNVVSVVPRVALMALAFWVLARAPYAAGDRTIINLLPNRGVGETLPNLNDTLTWVAGLLVLVPTMWFVPRLLVSVVMALITVPLSLRGRLGQALAEVYPRGVFVMSSAIVAAGLWMVASYAEVLDSRFTPLQPVLRDNFWLTIHVLTIVSSYGAGLLAFSLSMVAMGYYLFGRYRDGGRNGSKRPPEATVTLAGYAYKAIQVAVLLLATGTLLGALWADVSWGRFWGWDPKEVWALISLLVYLAILHGRFAGLFGNFGLHLGAILGASAIAFSWYGVNFVLGAGLHSYGFGDGGQYTVGGFLALTWVFWMAAAARYWMNCRAGFAAEAEQADADDALESSVGQRGGVSRKTNVPAT